MREGYSYIQRLYQPDRLKYPLKIKDPAKRGDPNNFERITWEEAIEIASSDIYEAIQRKQTLGYTPFMTKWLRTIDTFKYVLESPDVQPTITHLGNESTGAADAAKFDMVGPDAMTNAVADRLNSKFIMTWGLDPTRTTYYVEHSHWYNTVCREAGAELVVITPNYSDAAGMLSSGVTGISATSAITGKAIQDSIPGWVAIRPATDAALAVGMAYVMYKNNWYDETFVRASAFGFFPSTDPAGTITSTAPTAAEVAAGSRVQIRLSTKNTINPNDFTDSAGTTILKGAEYQGTQFTVTKGESFVEYLLSREVEWGGMVPDATTINDKYPQPDTSTPTYDEAEAYTNVLKYIAALTGVPAGTIEALGYKYGNTKPSFIDAGGGPQRAWNGVEWVQMMIALCTMSGNIDKAGGGAGYAMMSHGDLLATRLPIVAASMMLEDANTMKAIYVPMNEWSNVALTGKDCRSRQRFIDDVKITTGALAQPLDLSLKPINEKLIEIDVWFMNNYNGLTTLENINKSVEAIKSVKTVICCDQTMTPTALYSTLILPVCSHYETEGLVLPTGSTALFKQDAVISRLYKETRTDNEIRNAIADNLIAKGIDIPEANRYADSNPETANIAAKFLYDIMKNPSAHYKGVVDPNAEDKVISFEEFTKQGAVDFPIPRGAQNAFPPFATVSRPGDLQNSTGKINFWQPLWGHIRKKTAKTDNAGSLITDDPYGLSYDGFRNPTASYQPNIEPYENYFVNNDPREAFVGYKSPTNNGRVYGLYYMTNKARNRAHTVFDNVAMVKDQFEQVVHINPIDAAARGIADGDMVYAYNDRGCTHIPAKVSHYIIPGVISIEHGAWYRAHPTETVKVWIDVLDDDGKVKFIEKVVPLDVGGAENILTLGRGSSEQYVGQAISAQGGPCEVSKTKPE